MAEFVIDLDKFVGKNIADLKIGVLKELAKIKLHYEVFTDGKWQELPIKPFEKTIGSEKNEAIIKRVELD